MSFARAWDTIPVKEANSVLRERMYGGETTNRGDKHV